MFRKASASESASPQSTPPPLRVRVVSYNVLSSHLASPSRFTTLNPEHLRADQRLPVVLQKIDAELSKPDSQNSPPVVVCLQEVSYDWAGHLHAYFANKGYHLMTGLYGRSFNGYMGVGLAWPTNAFETLDASVVRVSDTREGGWPRPPLQESSSPGALTKVRSWLGSAAKFAIETVVPGSVRTLLGWAPLSSTDAEPWNYAERRMNVLLAANLRDKATASTFCVATYHMPCAFWDGSVMALHADLALRHVQRVAGNHPYVFAGDFNIKPGDPIHSLLTTGQMRPDDPAYPPPKHGIEWSPSLLEPVRSAYAVRSETNNEPDFTNYARVREDEPFVDTLDYIFLSPHWDVENVRELPNRQEAGGPFPNLDRGEPSDHLLIAATLSFQNAGGSE